MAQRIIVYGVTGSGKSTLAARLSERTGLPWHAVDELTWLPGWIARPADEQRRILTEICSADRWILDTAYAQWLDVPMARADLVVALDYPRLVSLWRLVRRSIRRTACRTPICNGNRETLRKLVSADSILAWHFRSFARKRERIRVWAAAEEGPAVVLLASSSATERWLEEQD